MTWNPTTGFTPTDSLSLQLLCSIPKKVHGWLVNLEDASAIEMGFGSYGKLRWNFSEEGATLIYRNEESNEFFQIWWVGHPSDINVCTASEPEVMFLADHLDYFINVERLIYNELEDYQAEKLAEYVTPFEEILAAVIKKDEA
jgi:hypothetical protein